MNFQLVTIAGLNSIYLFLI